MSPTALSLTGFIGWSLLLLLAVIGQRAYLTLTGKRAANSFKTEGTDISEFSGRLCRVHANCYESFPFIGGLLLLALAMDLSSITDPLALVVLICRLGQSIIHLTSVRLISVQIRFAFFLIQVVVCLYWTFQFMVCFTTA